MGKGKKKKNDNKNQSSESSIQNHEIKVERNDEIKVENMNIDDSSINKNEIFEKQRNAANFPKHEISTADTEIVLKTKKFVTWLTSEGYKKLGESDSADYFHIPLLEVEKFVVQQRPKLQWSLVKQQLKNVKAIKGNFLDLTCSKIELEENINSSISAQSSNNCSGEKSQEIHVELEIDVKIEKFVTWLTMKGFKEFHESDSVDENLIPLSEVENFVVNQRSNFEWALVERQLRNIEAIKGSFLDITLSKSEHVEKNMVPSGSNEDHVNVHHSNESEKRNSRKEKRNDQTDWNNSRDQSDNRKKQKIRSKSGSRSSLNRTKDHQDELYATQVSRFLSYEYKRMKIDQYQGFCYLDDIKMCVGEPKNHHIMNFFKNNANFECEMCRTTKKYQVRIRIKKDSFLISKELSSILRHNAGRHNLRYLDGGFLYIDNLLRLPKFKAWDTSLEDIMNIVETNDKKRFAVQKEDNGKWKIRANQGHSVEIAGLDMKKLDESCKIQHIVHGSYYECLGAIKRTGLSKMNRTHIHFAAGLPQDKGVISGMRASCEVSLVVNMIKAMEDGFDFFKSANDVYLCPGNKDGFLPAKYISKIIDRKTGNELQNQL